VQPQLAEFADHKLNSRKSNWDDQALISEDKRVSDFREEVLGAFGGAALNDDDIEMVQVGAFCTLSASFSRHRFR
jgi:hypothetical protein